MFTFFDIPPHGLPQDTEYYFNILVISIECPEGFLGEGITRIEDLSKIKEPRPICVIWYTEKTPIVRVRGFSHAVVEINTKTQEVTWYNMINFETEHLFPIDPIWEDFDYEEEEDDPDD